MLSSLLTKNKKFTQDDSNSLQINKETIKKWKYYFNMKKEFKIEK